jgi:flagellar biosynthetic protein FliR
MVLDLAGGLFVVALKIAAPVLVLLLLVNAAMGVLAKLIPQLNVFIVGFPAERRGRALRAGGVATVHRALAGASFARSAARSRVVRALG